MTDTTTIQLWPGGESVTFAGDPHGEDLRIYPPGWADSMPARPATAEERTAIRVAVLAERLLREEVRGCDSALVDMLREQDDDGLPGFQIDDIENLLPDPEEMDAAEMRTYVEDRGGDLPDAPDLPGDRGDDDPNYLDALRDAVRDCAEPVEVFEWWRVSRWLCDHLRAIGEPVIDNGFGRWWGRTCTGQAVIMDGTLQRVAARVVGGVA